MNRWQIFRLENGLVVSWVTTCEAAKSAEEALVKEAERMADSEYPSLVLAGNTYLVMLADPSYGLLAAASDHCYKSAVLTLKECARFQAEPA